MKKNSIALLAAISAAMAAEPHYLFATPKDAEELVKAGFAEQNPDVVDGDKLATRLTEAGVAEAAKAANNPATGSQGTTAVTSFEIYSDLEMPKARGGRKGEVYPFDTLEVGQAFFIPATDDKPEPADSIASTVTAANKRNKDENGKSLKKFVVRSTKEDHQLGKGALVFRIEVPASEAPAA